MSNLDLGLIGNCAISALVDKQARIVWCCLPRFDGDPVFHQLLGSASCDPDDGAFTVELVDFKSCEQSLFPIPGICAKMTTSPWTAVVLPRKFIELGDGQAFHRLEQSLLGRLRGFETGTSYPAFCNSASSMRHH
ncbi:MAG: trehalase-like domain-containing protein [Rhodomicrobium sp.]